MTALIRPARRSEAKPIIGLHSESGAGKTLSALLVAVGYAKEYATLTGTPYRKPVMMETEGGRGEAYADDPRLAAFPGQAAPFYDVIPIRDDFAPAKYLEGLKLAEKENVTALVIDSASHEWEGAGGILSMAADNEVAGKKGVLVWQKPKIAHQREFMLPLMQTPIPLVILCMRSKYPMEQKGDKWVRSTTLEPKQAADILFEMFIHGHLTQDHKFHGDKYTREDLKPVFVDGQPLTMDTGSRLAQWSKALGTPGAATQVAGGGTQATQAPAVGSPAHAPYLTALQVAELQSPGQLAKWWRTQDQATRDLLEPHKEALKKIEAASQQMEDMEDVPWPTC